MAKTRKMSDAEIDLYLQDMHKNIGKKLDEIKAMLPPGYLVTLVARHPDVAGGQMILTEDTDAQGIAKAILDEKTKIVGGVKKTDA